jgi:membrane-associated phospholipid phosphatase
MRARDQVTAAPDARQRRRWGLRPGGPVAPLLPAAARRPAAILALCCLVLVVALGLMFAHQSHGSAIDDAVDSWVMGLHVSAHALSRLTLLGDGLEMTTLTALLAIGCLAARRVGGAVLAVVSVPVAAALTELVLKPLVHRTITGDLTYPSGHTTGTFALAAVIAVVVLGSPGGRARLAVRIAVVIAAALVASAVGFAMIGLRYHYFTDTVGGAAVGIGTVLGVAFLLDSDVIRRWLGRLGR